MRRALLFVGRPKGSFTNFQVRRSINKLGVHTHLHPAYTRSFTRQTQGSITKSRFRRPFAMSAPDHSDSETSQYSDEGEEWEAQSAESKLQSLLHPSGSNDKWGWVIYRTCYEPGLNSQWNIIKHMTETKARERVATSDAPALVDKMDWVFVEDSDALNGATREELKRRFKDWARARNPDVDMDKPVWGRSSRFTYFIEVDEEALCSIGSSDAHVKIVRGWEPVTVNEDEDDDWSDDWMKIALYKIDLDFYVELDNEESWYLHHR